jgi:curli biogenesis system outer membrane secretion channel CsgG
VKKYLLVLVGALVLALSAFAAKPRVAIVDFENKSGSAWGHWAIGEGVSDMLATAMVKSGKFEVYERSQMEKILQEQNMQMSGAMTPESAVKVGALLGVQYLVMGSVNQFGQKETGVSALGIGVKKTTARVACDVRIVDVSSGKIVSADTGLGEESAAGFSDNAVTGIDFGSRGFDETIIGKATNKCVVDLMSKISVAFGGGLLQGAIIKVADKQIYVNIGNDSGVKVGTLFSVMRKGEEMIDPQTGENLGSDDTQVGTLKITQLKGKFCIGELTDKKDNPQAGDLVVEIKATTTTKK